MKTEPSDEAQTDGYPRTIARTWQEALQFDAESIDLSRRFANLEDPLAAAELERAMEARERKIRALFEGPKP